MWLLLHHRIQLVWRRIDRWNCPSTGFFQICETNKKPRIYPGFLLTRKDSNLDCVDQNHMCYLYTTGQYQIWTLEFQGCKTNNIFSSCQKFNFFSCLPPNNQCSASCDAVLWKLKLVNKWERMPVHDLKFRIFALLNRNSSLPWMYIAKWIELLAGLSLP